MAESLKTWQTLIPSLSQAQRRWYVGQKALELGRGGIEQIHALTGISRTTIIRGMQEVKRGKPLKMGGRVRKRGGGRKAIESVDAEMVEAINEILEESTAGNPMSLLKWTSKTCRSISDELKKRQFDVSHTTVCRLLHEQGYTLQSNRKEKEGSSHPDRNAQFNYISEQAQDFMSRKCPVISVDTKKKERVGEFKNPGQAWKRKDEATIVNTHDYPHLGIGTAVPYGAYDIARNEGFVNVGLSHDTAEFAVESIRQWWRAFGKKHYPKTRELLICADSGGSNAARSRLWKAKLQEFADQSGIAITVAHYPPGTSKWNKIEHRMFSFISLNWKGKPLVNYETAVNLIGATKTRKGLQIKARLDRRSYEKGKKVPDEIIDNLEIEYHSDFPAWNYTIRPRA
jgi:transposase